jgi:hypothetical protein
MDMDMQHEHDILFGYGHDILFGHEHSAKEKLVAK